MTQEQQDIVSFYTGASVVGFCVCIAYLFCFRIYFYCRKNVFTSTKSSRPHLSTVPYRALHGPSGYIPLVKKQEILHPILCCDVQKLPTTVLPLDNTRSEHIIAQAVSVCSAQEFSASTGVDDGYLNELFGSVVYFEDPNITLSAPASSEPSGIADSEFAATTLPIGWEIAKTQTGKSYYIDHNSKTTHWRIPPRPHPHVDSMSPLINSAVYMNLRYSV